MYEETTKHPKREHYIPPKGKKKGKMGKKGKSNIPDNENIKEAIKENKEKQKEPKNDYRIYGVKKTQEFIKVDRDLPRPLATMIEKGGGCLGIFSPPGSGKSNLLTNLILREEFLKDLFDGGLYLISPTIHSDLTAEKMIDYCENDVIVTEDSYVVISPYIYHNNNFAVLRGGHKWECPECSGKDVEMYHKYTTAMGVVRRNMKCNDCKKQYRISNKTYLSMLKYLSQC